MSWLLDTNICSFILKNQPALAAHRLMQHRHDEIFVSSVTVFEMRFGCELSNARERRLQEMSNFLRPFKIVPFDEADATQAGLIRAELQKAGTPIGPYDRLIAAQALQRNLTLVTNNTREFKRVKGLKLADWSV